MRQAKQSNQAYPLLNPTECIKELFSIPRNLSKKPSVPSEKAGAQQVSAAGRLRLESRLQCLPR